MAIKNIKLLKYILIFILYMSSSLLLVQAWEDDDIIYWKEEKLDKFKFLSLNK